MTDYGQLEHEVDAVEGLIWDVASHVWEYAELGYKEYKSSSYVCEALEQQGFAISERGIGGLETSWVATSGNGGLSDCQPRRAEALRLLHANGLR